MEDMNGWMGCYGDDTVPTPNIDRLATRGVRFDRAYMPAGVCSATRSAIALGAMQTSLGVHNHRSSRGRAPGEVIHLPKGVKTAYEVFRDNGYYVYNGGGKNDFNFVWDIDDLYDFDGRRIGFGGPHWQKRKEGQPFFAQIQLRGGKNSGKFRGSKIAGRNDTDTDPAKVDVPPYYPDHPIIRREIAHHYDCIRQTDDEVGQIVAALQADRLLESSIVFFWTDHGMRLPRHKQWLYEGGIRVPLVVAGPSIAKGSVRSDLVSGIDITTTSLALAGIEPLRHMEGRNVFASDYEPRQFVVSARDRCDYTIERVRAVTTKRFKYLRNFLTDRPFMQPQYRDGRDYIEIGRRLHLEGKLDAVQDFMWSETRVPEELYDLEKDPHEIRNLAADPKFADELEQHREMLQSWIRTTGDKGQAPESPESLRGVLKRWSKQAVNPEYDAVGSQVDADDVWTTAAGKPAEAAIALLRGEPQLEMQQVFRGERFPNIVVAVDGTVIATWGSSSVRARRSTDGGKTWGDEIVIAKPGFQAGGLTVDETTGDIIAFAEAHHPPAPLLVFRSSDQGKTWKKQDTAIGKDSRGNVPSLHMNEHGITLRHGKHKGRLLRPSRSYAGKNDRARWPQHYTNAIYSDDGGKTWKASEPFPAFGTGEATVAELCDGTIYYNSRRHWAEEGADPRRRWIAWSRDGGVTWKDLSICKALPDGPQDTNYGLMGGLARLPVRGRDVFVFSNCISPRGRNHGTVWASFDGGKTWPVKRLVFAGGFAYSSTAAGRPQTPSEGWIYVQFEGGPKGGSTVARFNLSWLLAGDKTGDGALPDWLAQ